MSHLRKYPIAKSLFPNATPVSLETVRHQQRLQLRQGVAVAEVEALPADDVLAQTADLALMGSDEAGNAWFDVVLKHELLGDLTCRIALGVQGAVRAHFRVQDVNARRLLEGERDRLRVMLESRGLRVEGIDVVLGES